MSKNRLWRGRARGAFAFLSMTFAIAIYATSALAQTETGQISGRVTDPNGAVVAGATVKVKSLQTGREATATSDNQGLYTVPSLQSGLYEVTTQSSNFKPTTQRVQVTLGSRVVGLEIELDAVEPLDADPWNSYIGCRYAWADRAAGLVGLAAGPLLGADALAGCSCESARPAG